MPQTTPFTVRFESEELLQNIDALAESMDRPRSWIINQAIKDYVEANIWQITKIEEGIKSLDEGKSIPHQEVMDKLEAKLKKTCK